MTDTGTSAENSRPRTRSIRAIARSTIARRSVALSPSAVVTAMSWFQATSFSCPTGSSGAGAAQPARRTARMAATRAQ